MTTFHFYSLRLALLLGTTSLLSCTSSRQFERCRVVQFKATVDQSAWRIERITPDSLYWYSLLVPPDSIPWRQWRADSVRSDVVGIQVAHFTARSEHFNEFIDFCGGFIGQTEACVVSMLGEPDGRTFNSFYSDHELRYLLFDPKTFNYEHREVIFEVCGDLVVSVWAIDLAH